jgi:DNA polymerase III delta prime subunit
MDTDAFLQHYFNVLEIYGEVSKGQWTSIITSIRTNQSILQSEYDILENVLKDELSLMKDTDILAMYKETEEGSSLEDNKESYSIDFIQMALVEELMDRITSIAWEQANQLP